MFDEINKYVQENPVGSGTRVELMRGDGWSVQLVGDGYFGEQQGWDKQGVAFDRPDDAPRYCGSGYPAGYMCTRSLGHAGPHVASAHGAEDTFLCFW